MILKPEQKLVVLSLMEKKDVLAVLPTGFGKSLIFLLSLLLKMKGIQLVLVVHKTLVGKPSETNSKMKWRLYFTVK